LFLLRCVSCCVPSCPIVFRVAFPVAFPVVFPVVLPLALFSRCVAFPLRVPIWQDVPSTFQRCVSFTSTRYVAFSFSLRFAFPLRFCCVSVALRWTPSVLCALRCAIVTLRWSCVASPWVIALRLTCAVLLRSVVFQLCFLLSDARSGTQRNGNATQGECNARERNLKGTQRNRNTTRGKPDVRGTQGNDNGNATGKQPKMDGENAK
jgi:hypothetical protein